jgi:release factor glutamine methyltransferase
MVPNSVAEAIELLVPVAGSAREAQNWIRILERDGGIRFNADDHSLNADFIAAFTRLLNQEPIQYIVGKVWFLGMELKVDQRVLIPRPETEELADSIIKFFRNKPFQPSRILDIGLGSGCLLLALRKHFLSAIAYGIDLSSDAIDLALENAESNALHFHPVCIDFLDKSQWNQIPDGMDLLVSNPPYISRTERCAMSLSTLRFEPEMALYASDRDPLEFYHALAEFLIEKCAKNAILFTEINEFRADETKSIFTKLALDTQLMSDLQGKNRYLQITRLKE